jgi:hypothetical protein
LRTTHQRDSRVEEKGRAREMAKTIVTTGRTTEECGATDLSVRHLVMIWELGAGERVEAKRARANLRRTGAGWMGSARVKVATKMIVKVVERRRGQVVMPIVGADGPIVFDATAEGCWTANACEQRKVMAVVVVVVVVVAVDVVIVAVTVKSSAELVARACVQDSW